MKVVLHALTKEFHTPRGAFRVLGGIQFEVREQEFFGIIGPTGCGKTTLLQIIAGLDKPTQGSVQFVGERRTKAMVSMVFQEAALMPWRTVEDNVPLGDEFRLAEPSLLKRISRHFLELVGLADFRAAHPHELSGGMKQKVSFTRALANDPEVILMDEPFANLDAQTRLLMREELLRIWERDKKTVILVTHNIEEAVMLCDRIAVLSAPPAVVKSVLTVDVPRPRTIKSMSSPDFARCVERIWDLLRYEVDKTLRAQPTSKPPAAQAETGKKSFLGGRR